MLGQTVTIAVDDVEASSRWYGTLLECSSPLDQDHKHRELFDVLVDQSGEPALFLTRWDHHPLAPLRDVERGHPGHGVVLSFEVDDVESSWRRAGDLGATVVAEAPREPGVRGHGVHGGGRRRVLRERQRAGQDLRETRPTRRSTSYRYGYRNRSGAIEPGLRIGVPSECTTNRRASAVSFSRPSAGVDGIRSRQLFTF